MTSMTGIMVYSLQKNWACDMKFYYARRQTRPRSRRHEAAAASPVIMLQVGVSVVFMRLSRGRQSYFSLVQSVILSMTGGD